MKPLRTSIQILFAAAVSCSCLWTRDGQATATTNIYDDVLVTTNSYVASATGGNEVVDIWRNGSDLTVVTNIFMQPTGAGSRSIIVFDGSTNTVQGGTSVNALQMAAVAGSTAIVSFVNNSLLDFTGDSIGFGMHIGDSSGYNALLFSNSTLRMHGTVGGVSVGYSVNQRGYLGVDGSVLDLNNLFLGFGWNNGAYGQAVINNSTITNVVVLYVGNSTTGNGNVTLTDSLFEMHPSATIGRFNVGGGTNAILTLDHSTFRTLSGNDLGDIASVANRTGTVNIVNGSLFSYFATSTAGRPFKVGSGGYGVINVSNSTLEITHPVANFHHGDLEMGTASGSIGVVNLWDGTNTVERNLIVGEVNGGTGHYNADGASLVQVQVGNLTPTVGNLGNLILGRDAGSTGTFTVAGTSHVIVTNATNNSSLIIGAGGQGTFTMNAGMVVADLVFATNGPQSILDFDGGGTMVAESFVIGSNSNYRVTLNSATLGSGYGQLQVLNSATLSNSILTITMGYEPAAGETFTLIDNQSANPLYGEFAGLTNNQFVDASQGGIDAYFHIQYDGGIGANDLLLIATIPEPSGFALLALAGLVVWRRCR